MPVSNRLPKFTKDLPNQSRGGSVSSTVTSLPDALPAPAFSQFSGQAIQPHDAAQPTTDMPLDKIWNTVLIKLVKIGFYHDRAQRMVETMQESGRKFYMLDQAVLDASAVPSKGWFRFDKRAGEMPKLAEGAEGFKEKIQASHERPVVTEIKPAGSFFKAEDYHQDYLKKRGRMTC